MGSAHCAFGFRGEAQIARGARRAPVLLSSSEGRGSAIWARGPAENRELPGARCARAVLDLPRPSEGWRVLVDETCMGRGRFTPLACLLVQGTAGRAGLLWRFGCSDPGERPPWASASRMAVAGGCCSGQSCRRVGRRRSAGRRLEQETGMRSRLGSLQEAGPPTAGLPAERGSRQSPADRRAVCEGRSY